MTEPSFSSDGLPGATEATAKRRRRPKVWVLVVLIGLLLLVLAVVVHMCSWMRGVVPRPFDRAEWLNRGLASHLAAHPARQEMVDDLLEKRLKVGMSMSEVHWLIGAPDKDPYYHPGDWTYLLGTERSIFGADNEWLAIDFDELGCVERVELETD